MILLRNSLKYLPFINNKLVSQNHKIVTLKVNFCQSFKNNSDQQLILKINRNNQDKHQYNKHLRDPEMLSYQVNMFKTLVSKYKKSKSINYKQLRSSINELLSLYQYILAARSYQDFDLDFKVGLELITDQIRLTFSEQANKTYENVDQEKMKDYQFIEFAKYFQICNHLQISQSHIILDLYLHSYMQLLEERNLYRYIEVYEVLRLGQSNEKVDCILEKSSERIGRQVAIFQDKISKGYTLDQLQMLIYLSHIRPSLNNISKQQTIKIAQILINFLIKFQSRLPNNTIQLQNITYCIFILLKLGDQIEQFKQRTYSYIIENKQGLSYLTVFNNHEDKLNCIKINILFDILHYQKQNSLLHSYEPEQIQATINQISCKYWRYKYVLWFLDLLLNKSFGNLQLIQTTIQSLKQLTLSSSNRLDILSVFMNQLTSRFQNSFPQIIGIHRQISSWLCKQSKQSLLTQSPSTLCQILILADNHPSLQSIYAPYLRKILELSLGKFEWVYLTQIYYFGLRFGVEQSEQGRQNMEYVRRYILNEYASMGIRRRQIPEQSYFYKIISITTPQKFYQNYMKHDHQ